MASYNHHTQKAFVLMAASQYEAQSSSSSSKLMLYEKELPALPDVDTDEDEDVDFEDVESKQSGGEIPGAGTESVSLEDVDNRHSNSEIKSEDYEQMLNDRAYSSTHVSSWGYGTYWTRRGNSMDMGSSESLRETLLEDEDGGDSNNIDFRTVSYYQPIALIHEQHESDQDSVADCADNEREESDDDGSSVHSSSSSAELGICVYGPGTASSPGIVQDPGPSSLAQVSSPVRGFADIVLHEDDSEEESSLNESTTASMYTAQSTLERSPIAMPQPKVTFFPMSKETPKIKLPSPHEMTRSPSSMLKRLFSKSTTPTPTSPVPEKRGQPSPQKFPSFHEPISRQSTDYVIEIPSSRDLVSGKMGHVVMRRKRSISLPMIHELSRRP